MRLSRYLQEHVRCGYGTRRADRRSGGHSADEQVRPDTHRAAILGIAHEFSRFEVDCKPPTGARATGRTF
jgi:hypothetical protein